MNAYQVNFESVYGIKDSVVAMFKTLENTGLRSFLSFPVIINEHSLLDFYANSIVTINKKISYSFDGQTFLRWSSVRFHFLSTYRRDLDFSQISSLVISQMKLKFSIYISWKKKEMNMEYQVLMDHVSKALLVKAGSFDASIKKKFLVMDFITVGVKIN